MECLHGSARHIVAARGGAHVLPRSKSIRLGLRQTLPDLRGRLCRQFRAHTASQSPGFDACLAQCRLCQTRQRLLAQAQHHLARAHAHHGADGFRPGFPQSAVLSQWQELLIRLLPRCLIGLWVVRQPGLKGIIEKLRSRHAIRGGACCRHARTQTAHGAADGGTQRRARCCAHACKQRADTTAHSRTTCRADLCPRHTSRHRRPHSGHTETEARPHAADRVARAARIARQQPLRVLICQLFGIDLLLIKGCPCRR